MQHQTQDKTDRAKLEDICLYSEKNFCGMEIDNYLHQGDGALELAIYTDDIQGMI